ncbi:hypothetical protein LY78DRAFT_470491 [Colletotrichum sublineola]|nr:hypothetical protein LY78DRAFT_470491 [Colletotrichum sublineola]
MSEWCLHLWHPVKSWSTPSVHKQADLMGPTERAPPRQEARFEDIIGDTEGRANVTSQATTRKLAGEPRPISSPPPSTRRKRPASHYKTMYHYPDTLHRCCNYGTSRISALGPWWFSSGQPLSSLAMSASRPKKQTSCISRLTCIRATDKMYMVTLPSSSITEASWKALSIRPEGTYCASLLLLPVLPT